MMPTFQIKRRSPKSNTERQREFRERHPGYYQRLHASRRAGRKAFVEQAIAAAYAAAAEARTPLALPPPVEAIVIPGMTTIAATPAATQVPIPVSRLGDAKANWLS